MDVSGSRSLRFRSGIALITITISLISFFGINALYDLSASAQPLEVEDFQKLRVYIEDSRDKQLSRAAIGDVMISKPGNEMVTCSSGGHVVVHYGTRNAWRSETIYKAFYKGTRELVRINSVAIGDAYPEIPGDEVLMVGDDMELHIAYHNGTSWTVKKAYETVDWLYEVAISDMDGDGQSEIVVVGEERAATLLKREGARWMPTIVTTDEFLLDACLIIEASEENSGSEIISAGKTGRVFMAYNNTVGYGSKVIAEIGMDVSDICAIDIDPRYPGREILVSTYIEGSIFLLRKDETGSWVKEKIHLEGDSIWGMEAGYLDPDRPVLAFGSSKHRLGLIEYDNGYRVLYPYYEDWNIIGSAIGDLDPFHVNAEVFSLSQEGRLTMLYRDEPGLAIDLPFTRTRSYPGEYLEIPFAVMQVGGLTGRYSLDAIGSMGPSLDILEGNGTTVSTVGINAPTEPGFYDLELVATQGAHRTSAIIGISVDLLSDQVRFERSKIEGTIDRDRQYETVITTISETGLDLPLTLTHSEPPKGMDLKLSRVVCDPCNVPDSVSATITASTSTIPDDYVIFIVGTSNNTIRRAVALTITVREESLEDFSIIVPPPAEDIVVGTTRELEVRFLSLNGFMGTLEIQLGPLPETIKAELSIMSLVPTSNVTLSITSDEEGGPYLITVTATDGKMTRSNFIKVAFVRINAGIELNGPSSPVPVVDLDDGMSMVTFDVHIDPGDVPVRSAEITSRDLPEDLDMSINPPELSGIPYSMNITLSISGPRDLIPNSINITVIDLDGGKEHTIEVFFVRPDRSDPENGNSLPALLISAIVLVLFVAVLLVFLFLRGGSSNLLKSGVNLRYDNGPKAETDLEGDKARERHYDRDRGSDRSVPGLRRRSSG